MRQRVHNPGDTTTPRPCSPRAIRWRNGEIIGAGAYGRVYIGMNLDSGELLAVKQVLISVNNVTKEKAQAHITELEEEVKLLRNLSHPNIVRYLGTAREEEALNILQEFVPGGSIASLLGKFGSFTEPVIRMYTGQLLLGLEYLHNNNILHRDIKGANILVDNKGCIKLADFGASKKVVELGTQASTQRSRSLTVALQHPFVTEQIREESSATKISQQRTSVANLGLPPKDNNSPRTLGRTYDSISSLSKGPSSSKGANSFEPRDTRQQAQSSYGKDMNCSVRLDSDRCNSFSGAGNSVRFDSVRSEYQTDAGHSVRSELQLDVGHSVRLDSVRSEFLTEVCTPHYSQLEGGVGDCAQEDDDDVTESKIRAFFDEKAMELKRLQTPLFEELYSIWNTNQTGPSESFIAPLSPSPARPSKQSPSSKWPSQRSSMSGRSIGLRNSRDSEQSVSSGSPIPSEAPSVNSSWRSSVAQAQRLERFIS